MPIAITNGKILTITRGTIDGGTILIEDGKIKAVGKDLPIPAGAEVVDASGQWVMPGLIDAHSHMGIFGEPMTEATLDGNETSDPVTPHVRALDAINPADPAFMDVLPSGVTAAWTGPGSANVIGGLGLVVKLTGKTIDAMVVPGSESMKMALGENPKRVYGGQKKTPSTRMGNAAVLRDALIKAQNYMEKFRRAEDDAEKESKEKKTKVEPKYPERDLKMEALARCLRRELRCRIHSHRADDILTAVRIAEEFDLDIAIEHATEGYKVADVLAEKKIPCTVGPHDMFRAKMELENFRLENAGLMARAGVKIAIQVDAFSTTRWLPIHTGVLIRHGLPEEEAFKAVTINAAEIIGVDDRMGSLEPGKDADIAIFSGHPFCTFTRCEKVFINGREVYDAGKAGAAQPGKKSSCRE